MENYLSFGFTAKPHLENIDRLGKAKLTSTGEEVDTSRLIPDHDIYHHLVDTGYIYELYRQRTGITLTLDKYSTTFHGEALIECLGHFIGNLEDKGSCYLLPHTQKGLRSGKGRENRFFPVLPSLLNSTGTSDITFAERNDIHKFAKFVILASLLNGDIAKKFCQKFKHHYTQLQSVRFFVSEEFKNSLDQHLEDTRYSPILLTLEQFLQDDYNSSLAQTVEYSTLAIEICHRLFLNPDHNDYTYSRSGLIVRKSPHLEYISSLNKSVNSIHDAYPEELYIDQNARHLFKKLLFLRNAYKLDKKPSTLVRLEATKEDISDKYGENLLVKYGFCDLKDESKNG